MQNSPLAAAAVKAQALLHALLVNFAGPSREWNSAFAEADILHMLRTGCGDSNYLSGSPETPKKIRQPNVDLRLIPAVLADPNLLRFFSSDGDPGKWGGWKAIRLQQRRTITRIFSSRE